MIANIEEKAYVYSALSEPHFNVLRPVGCKITAVDIVLDGGKQKFIIDLEERSPAKTIHSIVRTMSDVADIQFVNYVLDMFEASNLRELVGRRAEIIVEEITNHRVTTDAIVGITSARPYAMVDWDDAQRTTELKCDMCNRQFAGSVFLRTRCRVCADKAIIFAGSFV